ncbi:MAG: hypothetical protein EBV82_09015, partial [Chitinophagia bacterium]|nr:hypothetical protein [Chitinophagia bacterium]
NSGALKLTSSTNSMIGADFEGSLTLDHRLFSEGGRNDITKNFKELGQNLNKNPLTPMGASVAIENYTGHELTWKRGGEATFKEKGHEFETLDPRANNIGKANVTDDPKEVGKIIAGNNVSEGSIFSETFNKIPGFNSAVAIPHDKFGNEGFASHDGPLQLSIIPFIPIGYYGLLGKTIRNTYEEPNLNNSKQ